jgi:hypothetical protein
MALDSFLSEACVILIQDIERLAPLSEKLKEAATWEEKEEVIAGDLFVQEYLCNPSILKTFLAKASIQSSFVLKSVIAIGQAEAVFGSEDLTLEEIDKRIEKLLETLLTVEKFYKEIGGIVGYHLSMIKLLCRPEERSYGAKAVYHAPNMNDISILSADVKEAIYCSIEKMHHLAEIYPVGGAADRLKLSDPLTGSFLPAAKLKFCGKTLLERLVTDVQAKEYLYFKLHGKQITVPIAMMTSSEKNNHERILSLCRELDFFHRKEESFFFFCQPSVPTITKEGRWCMQRALEPLLRPGGHGVIWKLARDTGCFEWLKKQNVTKALVRQINNPIASDDYGLYAFSGIGLKNNKDIGFCSCSRLVKSAEGINVLIEEKKGDAYEYTLTNIEYCDFQKYGIADEPSIGEVSFSKYPSNTNLLFIDIEAIEEALLDTPIPGMLVNLKKISYKDERGRLKEEPLARLESMMQNIADCFTESFSSSKDDSAIDLPSYITYNTRRKTISTTKKEYTIGSSLMETPEGCFIDMMHNARELLLLCGFSIASLKEDPIPAFSFQYHPALGPFYSIISQKLQGGSLSLGSELELAIAQLEIKGLTLDGSLRIEAENIMGHFDEDSILCYSDHVGKCTLKNVHIVNEGIDYDKPCVFWKKELSRRQSCYIKILGNGEFFAENVTLAGDFLFIVPDGIRMIVKEIEGQIQVVQMPINHSSWQWNYSFTKQHEILLTKSVLC